MVSRTRTRFAQQPRSLAEPVDRIGRLRFCMIRRCDDDQLVRPHAQHHQLPALAGAPADEKVRFVPAELGTRLFPISDFEPVLPRW